MKLINMPLIQKYCVVVWLILFISTIYQMFKIKHQIKKDREKINK